MNETRRKPTTWRQSPSLFNKWHGIFYMPSRIDTAGHTKAFGYPVAEHWGESRNVQVRGWHSNRQPIGLESNALPTEPPRLPRRITYPWVLNRRDLLPTAGIVCKEQPHHEKAIPMGPNNWRQLFKCYGVHQYNMCQPLVNCLRAFKRSPIPVGQVWHKTLGAPHQELMICNILLKHAAGIIN